MSPQSLPPVDPTCPCPPRAAGSCCHDTPRELPRPGGSYPNSYGLRWLELPALPSTAHPRSERGSERLAKAPPWLFSAESDMAPLPYVTHAFRLQPSTTRDLPTTAHRLFARASLVWTGGMCIRAVCVWTREVGARARRHGCSPTLYAPHGRARLGVSRPCACGATGTPKPSAKICPTSSIAGGRRATAWSAWLYLYSSIQHGISGG